MLRDDAPPAIASTAMVPGFQASAKIASSYRERGRAGQPQQSNDANLRIRHAHRRHMMRQRVIALLATAALAAAARS